MLRDPTTTQSVLEEIQRIEKERLLRQFKSEDDDGAAEELFEEPNQPSTDGEHKQDDPYEHDEGEEVANEEKEDQLEQVNA